MEVKLNICVIYDEYHGPVEHAEWENFITGASEDNPVMFALTLDEGSALVSGDVKGYLELDFPILHVDYPSMDIVHVDHLMSWIRHELDHWDTILSSLENLNSDILRFLVIKKVPLDTIMRFILSRRNVDREGKKCSEKEAELSWKVE